jgi:hypothetical protein
MSPSDSPTVYQRAYDESEWQLGQAPLCAACGHRYAPGEVYWAADALDDEYGWTSTHTLCERCSDSSVGVGARLMAELGDVPWT